MLQYLRSDIKPSVRLRQTRAIMHSLHPAWRSAHLVHMDNQQQQCYRTEWDQHPIQSVNDAPHSRPYFTSQRGHRCIASAVL